MESIRFMRLLVYCGAILAALSTILFFKQGHFPLLGLNEQSVGLLASNTYMGPTKPIPGKPQLVKVQILIQDSPEADGAQIVSAKFNKENIPLKPRDIYGNRGGGSFQVAPGKYKLNWTTSESKIAWPRQVEHEEEVTVSPRDLWIQILIQGEKATIS